MTAESVLGIDVGTSATKAVLAQPDGTILARAERAHAISLPRPGWAEHDAHSTWWRDVVALCRELAPLAGASLRAVCASGIGPCVVPCDTANQPLRPAILYGIDTRAADEITELNQRLGEANILDRSGSALSSQALGPKLLWLRRNEPDVWAQTARWYMASSFIIAQLTGTYVLDHHSASQCNPLYDLDASTWASDWVDEVVGGVPLPELVWPSDQVGVVSPSGSEQTGLPVGTPVMAGTIDSWSEAFSVGARRTGDLMLMYGSTMFLVQVVDEPARHPLLWTTTGVESGTRTLAGGMSTAGSLTEWVRALGGNPGWGELISEAEVVPPGADGLLLLPYFAGERTPIYDPAARGVVVGLTLAHNRGHLLRAAYEGIGFGTRQILELMASASHTPTRIVAVGGGTRARLWLQTVSDITGVSQELPRIAVGACYGDALLAAIGAGLAEHDADWTTIVDTVEPSTSRGGRLNELYEIYLKLYLDSADAVHRIARAGSQRLPEATIPAR